MDKVPLNQWLLYFVVFYLLIKVRLSLPLVNSALHPSGVDKSHASFAGVKAGMSPLLGGG